MFSITIIAASTSIPNDTIKAKRVILFTVSPNINPIKSVNDKIIGTAKETIIASLNPNVKIKTETLDTEAYKTKINAEFAGDAKGIDVFYWWGAGTAKKLVDAGKVMALDDYLTDDVKSRMWKVQHQHLNMMENYIQRQCSHGI